MGIEPNPDSVVFALTSARGVLYVGGKFTRIDGQERNLLAALDTGTGKALPWRADAVSGYSREQAAVKSMAISGNTLYVAGFFSAIGGVLRDKIASLDTATGAVSNWDPNFTDQDISRFVLRYEFNTLAVSDNTVYIGGDFTVLGTFQTNAPKRNFIAALDTSKNNFESFTAWNPDADGPVTCLAVFCDTVFVGGTFTRIGGQPRNHIAALDPRTGRATDWNPNANGDVLSLMISGETVYVGGKFTRIGGQSRASLAALDIHNGQATLWNPKADYAVSGLAISGGRVVTGGQLGSGGLQRKNLAAFDARTGKPLSWAPTATGGTVVTTIQLQSVNSLAVGDDLIYVGGAFTEINGQPRNRLAAINRITGDLAAWNPNANGIVQSLLVVSNHVLATGPFTEVGGQPRKWLAALDLTSGQVTDWNPKPNESVNALATRGGQVYMAGRFTEIAGESHRRLAALDALTGQATPWNASVDDELYGLAMAGSSLYVGGGFRNISGQLRDNLAAVDIVTGTVTPWNPQVRTLINGRERAASVLAMAVSNDLVYVGGLFNQIGEQPRINLASISMAGTGVATGWAPDVDNVVNTLAVSGDAVYAGGTFKHVGGQYHPSLAVFPPVGAPRIVRQPRGQQVLLGQSVLLETEALGEQALSFQWQFNGTNILNATNRSLTIPNAPIDATGEYRVVATNRLGLIHSQPATAVVFQSVAIAAQPVARNVAAGTNVTFNVVATGNPPPTYQWRLNGVNIPGERGPTLTLRNVQPTDGGSYTVAVGGVGGSVNSEVAELIVSSPRLPFVDNLRDRVITNSLTGQGSGNSTNATKELSEPDHVGKPGRKSLWLGWRAPTNGVVTLSTRGSGFDTLLAVYTNALPAAPLEFANLRPVATDDDHGGFLTSEVVFQAVAGTEYLIVVDGFGKASGNIVLSWKLDPAITEAPRIFQQPLSQTIGRGESVTLSLVAFSTRPLTFQWFQNCDSIAGATNSTLLLTNMQATQVGRYTVLVSSGLQLIETAPAFLEINFSGDAGLVQKVASRDKLADRVFIASSVTQASFSDSVGRSSLRAVVSEPEARRAVTLNSAIRNPQSALELASTGFGGAPARGFSGTQIFHTFRSTKELGEPNHAGEPGGASSWYTIQAEEDAKMLVSTEGSDFDTVLAVYEGPPNPLGYDELLMPAAATDNNSGFDRQSSRVVFPTLRNRVYHVAVDGVNGAQGRVVLNYQLGSAPELIVQPLGGAWRIGNIVILVVQVRSRVPVLYQWQYNGVALGGATNATLVISMFQSANAGGYSCVVSNFAGVASSAAAVLQVKEALQLQAGGFGPGGAFRLLLSGDLGPTTVIQTSSNLINWLPVFTNLAPNRSVEFIEPNASNQRYRFYRAVE